MDFGKVEKFFLEKSIKLEKNRVLNEIVQSFITLIPIFMIGAFVLVLQNFPIAPVADFIKNVWGGLIYKSLGVVFEATYGIVAIYILVVVSFKYSVSITKGYSNINILNVIATVASYFILVGGETLLSGDGEEIKVILQQYTSERNIFLASVVAILSTRLTMFAYRFLVNGDTKSNIKADYTRTLKGILPIAFTVVVFMAIAMLVRGLTPYAHLDDMLKEYMNKPLRNMAKGPVSGIFLLLLQNIFWFFGIHGSNLFTDVTKAIFPDGSGSIYTKTFLDMYAVMGGCGITISLLAVGFFATKGRPQHQIMCSAIFPGIFNVNEIVVFGLPIVLNPVLIIPFILSPIVGFLLAWIATSSGLVPVVCNEVYWTTPPFISGYMATGSWKGAVLQIVIVGVCMLLYLPFIRLYINIQERLREDKINRIVQKLKDAEKNNKDIDFENLPGDLLRVVKELGEQLTEDVRKNRLEIYYQPQVNSAEQVASSEALLRWKGGTDRNIYPPLVIAIAKEYGIYDRLTRQIVIRALDDTRRIYEEIGEYMPVSVNIEVDQLVDEGFIDWVINTVAGYNMQKNTFGMEITEQEQLADTKNLSAILDKLKANGIQVSIDDFSMGYTSLAYLQQKQFDYIKLDGGIVKNIENNSRSREIVDSLINLGKTLGFEVVAEYVENRRLRDILYSMGCHKYQGYLYSPAIDVEQYIAYIRQMNGV